MGLIDIVGKKWAVCVVSLLGKYGTLRFGPIQRCLEGVSPATLTSTLRSLEKAGLVRRPPETGPRGDVRAYALTPAGRILDERLRPLAGWLRSAESPRGRRPRVASRGIGARARGAAAP